MTENELLPLIKQAYEADVNYFTGDLNGQSFKIRMNKDHARNSLRYDDQGVHNLSLLSAPGESARVFRKSGSGKLQWQINGVSDWQDAEEQILEFFYQIEND